MPLLPKQRKPKRVLPGFGLSLGYTMTYLGLIVLIPLSAIFVKTASLSPREFWDTVTAPEVLSAYRVSFGASLIAAVVNVTCGLVVAWVLVRYRFAGRRFVDAMIDLPFALPTAVAGLALTALYNDKGWLGRFRPGDRLAGWADGLSRGLHLRPPRPGALAWLNLNYAFSFGGIVVALVFIGLPFVVRTVQPVVQDLNREVEEAAASFGSQRWQTFRRVIFPELWPALLTGFALSLARGLGEYGSVVFISGNLPMRTEIAPHQIITKLEQYNYSRATAIAVVMLVASLLMLLSVNLLERWTSRVRG